MSTSHENGQHQRTPLKNRIESRLARQRVREATRDRFELAVRAEFPQEKPVLRTIAPALIINIGTSAAECGSRSKKLLQDQGTDSFVRFLAIDTDETAQQGAPGYLSFDDNEFVHIKMGRVRNVIDNPDAHKQLVRSLGIDDPQLVTFVERILEELKQAGQVRPIGLLALASNFAAVRDALRRTLDELNGVYSALERQLASSNRIVVRRNLTAYAVFSDAGGTGSSMALVVMALLRHLTQGLPVEIVAITMMPSTFEKRLQGKPHEGTRINANAFATMLELNAAYQGYFPQQNLQMGPDENNSLAVPAGLFSQLFVVGPHLADGRTLGSAEAVFDAVALHLAAIVGTEISDRVQADDANQATLRGLTPDPMTGQTRYISTPAAIALAFDSERASPYCSALQMVEFIELRVVGKTPSDEAIHALVQSWKNQPLPNDPMALEANELTAALMRIRLPNPAGVARSLYRAVQGDRKAYYRCGQFVQQAERLQSQFAQVQLPAMESKLSDVTGSLTSELASALRVRLNRLTKSESDGWEAVRAFTTVEAARLEDVAKKLASEAETQLATANTAKARAKEMLHGLRSILRRWFRLKSRQDSAAAQLQTALCSATGTVVRLGAQKIVESLHAEVLDWHRNAESTIAAARKCLVSARAIMDDNRAGKRLTTRSQAELDISTPASDQRLFADYRLDSSELLESLCQSMKSKPATALRRLVCDSRRFSACLEHLTKYFHERFAVVSIVDVLADQLVDSQTAADANARISQSTIACQPMWRAESGQNGVEFADTMLIGIPESKVEAKRDLVVKAMMQAATRRIHADSQYNGSVAHVVSGDMHRIYVIRRTHGACLHYLPELVRAKADYDRWAQSGGHTVHIFNPNIVMGMPTILPARKADAGEVAWALALAYAWIANRGPNWYWNLEKSDGQPAQYVCRLTSHWNGIAFENMARSSGFESLDRFISSGRIRYEALSDALPTQRLDATLEEVYESVRQNQEMIELVEAAFTELRETAGDNCVADDLERCVAELRRRKSSPLIQRMIDALSYQLRALRTH